MCTAPCLAAGSRQAAIPGCPARPGYFLPVRVLSRLFRRRFLEELQRLHAGGKLKFFGEHAQLADAQTFKAWLGPLRKTEWVVYAKRPFAGPQAVLAYLSRYTHRVAISNSRLLALDERGVSFRWNDYRAKGKTRYKIMTLSPQEFMRRFLLHVLPGGFHRIRHYGFLANGSRKAGLAAARELLLTTPVPAAATAAPKPSLPTLTPHDPPSSVGTAAIPWSSSTASPRVRQSAHHPRHDRLYIRLAPHDDDRSVLIGRAGAHPLQLSALYPLPRLRHTRCSATSHRLRPSRAPVQRPRSGDDRLAGITISIAPAP